MLTLTQIRAITDITYIPFGAVLLFAPIEFGIKILIFFSVVPAAIIGLTNPQSNELRNLLYSLMNYFVQPLIRIEFAIAGIIVYFAPPDTSGLLIVLATVPFVISLAFIAQGWLNSVILASWKKDNKPPFIRKSKF